MAARKPVSRTKVKKTATKTASRKVAKRPVAKKTKRLPATATPKRKVRATKLAPVLPTVAPSIAEPLSIPTVLPASALPASSFKALPEAPSSRFKLWLTVGLSMGVIICIWAYTLSQSLFNSSALETSADQIQLGNFVDSVSDDLADLKADTDTFVDTTKNTNSNQNINAEEQPSNAQLDNLFSDIQ